LVAVFSGQPQEPRIEGFVVDQDGNKLARIRIAADIGAVGDVFTDSNGHFELVLRGVAPGMSVRIRASDSAKRYEVHEENVTAPAVSNSRFITLKRAAAGRPSAQLTLSLERMQLTRPSGVVLANVTLPVADTASASKKAAAWVQSVLRAKFPTNEETLVVTVDPSNADALSIVQPPDALRQDRFWMFANGAKAGHPLIPESPEEIRAAMTSALISSEPVVFHFDRPGYELGFIQLRSAQLRQVHTVNLRRRENALLTVVADMRGNDALQQRFRADLSGPAMQVHSASQLLALEKIYEDSKKYDLRPEQRLTLLRQSRVDVLIGGVLDTSVR
jgi:hypothetical protein